MFSLTLQPTSLSLSLSLNVSQVSVFTMLPTVILKGTLIKKSQQKRRTSPCNYKERLFVLDTQDLTYSEQRPGVCTIFIVKLCVVCLFINICQKWHLLLKLIYTLHFSSLILKIIYWVMKKSCFYRIWQLLYGGCIVWCENRKLWRCW